MFFFVSFSCLGHFADSVCLSCGCCCCCRCCCCCPFCCLVYFIAFVVWPRRLYRKVRSMISSRHKSAFIPCRREMETALHYAVPYLAFCTGITTTGADRCTHGKNHFSPSTAIVMSRVPWPSRAKALVRISHLVAERRPVNHRFPFDLESVICFL